MSIIQESCFKTNLIRESVYLGCRGKMKIKGSMSAAQKFTPDIFPKPSKL
jgi:hypothetical protein